MAVLAMRRYDGATWEPGKVSGKYSKTNYCQSAGCSLKRAGMATAPTKSDYKSGTAFMYLCERCGKLWCRSNGLDYETGLELD